MGQRSAPASLGSVWGQTSQDLGVVSFFLFSYFRFSFWEVEGGKLTRRY
jgi:hypothetical protein